MPSALTSSSRPIKGLTHQAPAFAANSACVAEKQRVTVTWIFFSLSDLQVLKPLGVRGTFTATFFANDARWTKLNLIN